MSRQNIHSIEGEIEILKDKGLLDENVDTHHIASKMSYKYIDRSLDRIHESRRHKDTAIAVIFGLLVIAIIIIAYINMRGYNESLKVDSTIKGKVGFKEFGDAFLLFIASWIAYSYLSMY